jgi:predicted Zn-dependent peptidase
MEKLNKEEIDKTKDRLISANILEREDSGDVLFSLLLEEIAGNAEEYYKFEERINAVKLEDVRKLAKIKSISTFSLIPEE